MSLFKKILIYVIVVSVVSAGMFFYLFKVLTPVERYRMFNNAWGHRILVNWHFVRKLPNIIHLPYWFRETKLEEYNITISDSNLADMDNHMPLRNDGMSYDYLRDDSKYYVKAEFSEPKSGYSEEIKIRVRGTNCNNWDAFKKAYRIKFPKENYFQGQRSLNLFLPYDRAYFGEMLSSYRAKKLGIFTADFKLVRVYINGRDNGVYLASEPWSKELLAKNNIVDSNNIFSSKDLHGGSEYSLFSEERLDDWKSYTAEEEAGYFEELDTLFRLVDNADDEEFAKKISALIDLDKFYSWQIINDLAGSTHQNDNGNSVLIFRKETGKFEIVPWDVNLKEVEVNIYKSASVLVHRILSQDDFYDEYLKRLKDYVGDDKNLEDDLKYYDELYKEFKGEFYNDQAKLHNDLVFNKWIKTYRQRIIDNFENSKKLSEITNFSEKIETKNDKIFEPVGSFKNFNDIFLSIDEFIKKYPKFFKDKDENLALPFGYHEFNKDIIIPQNLRLKIYPGAKLVFGEGASLISYSPITAVGSEHNKIRIFPKSDKPWGVFAAVNTKEENEFEYIEVDGGSEDFINGIFFTSQFSLHNSKSNISNSIFKNSKSDDAMHAIFGKVNIKNSVFENNLSDGVDLDYVSGSLVENCVFRNNLLAGSNGDAIDLSGSEDVRLANNRLSNFKDKCVSVGERSRVEIVNNLVSGCGIGIAIKDDSYAIISNNIIVDNKEAGVSMYRKKQEFIVGGQAHIENNTMEDNGANIKEDELSKAEVAL